MKLYARGSAGEHVIYWPTLPLYKSLRTKTSTQHGGAGICQCRTAGSSDDTFEGISAIKEFDHQVGTAVPENLWKQRTLLCSCDLQTSADLQRTGTPIRIGVNSIRAGSRGPLKSRIVSFCGRALNPNTAIA